MKKKEEEKNGVLKCEDIQSVLFDYMTRELGEGRSDLIREHMRKCPDCQKMAADIQATLDLIHSASKGEPGIPAHLSEKHKARLIRAFMHPVLDWIYVHHILFSIIVTIVALTIIIGTVRKMRIWNNEHNGPVYTITVGAGRPIDRGQRSEVRNQESGDGKQESGVGEPGDAEASTFAEATAGKTADKQEPGGGEQEPRGGERHEKQ